MSSGTVPHEEVLKSIYDFLASCGYRESVIALQSESGVPYNVVHCSAASGEVHRPGSARGGHASAESFPPPSSAALETAVMDGNWAEVLHVYVDGLLLPENARAALYETVFEELLEVNGLLPAARAFLFNSPAFAAMRLHAPARCARLDRLLESFDPATWEERKKKGGTVTTDVLKRRQDALKSLLAAIKFTSEPYLGQLPAALFVARHYRADAQALKRSRDGDGDAGGDGAGPATEVAAASLGYSLAAPRTVARPYDCSEDGKTASLCLTLPARECGAAEGSDADAATALIGRSDGSLDFVDVQSGAAVGQPARHTHGVLALCLDAPLTLDGDDQDSSGAAPAGACWVAAGYRDGWVKVYNTRTRKLVRRFADVHTMGVTAVAFAGHKHAEELLGHHRLLITGSYDASLKVLSLATGAALFAVADPHSGAFVNDLCILLQTADSDALFAGVAVSAGNDGTLAFWRVHPDAEEIAEAENAEAAAAAKRTALLTRVGTNMNVRALHVECRDAIVASLTLLPASADPGSAALDLGGDTIRGEVLMVTRSGVALILSVTVALRGDAAATQPVRPTLLCLLRSSQPLRHMAILPAPWHSRSGGSGGGCGRQGSATEDGAPVLSVYGTDAQGTVLLYNVELAWRDTERWKAFGGAAAMTGPTDESPVVIAEVGHAVADLRVCPLPMDVRHGAGILVSAESLPTLYLLK